MARDEFTVPRGKRVQSRCLSGAYMESRWALPCSWTSPRAASVLPAAAPQVKKTLAGQRGGSWQLLSVMAVFMMAND